MFTDFVHEVGHVAPASVLLVVGERIDEHPSHCHKGRLNGQCGTYSNCSSVIKGATRKCHLCMNGSAACHKRQKTCDHLSRMAILLYDVKVYLVIWVGIGSTSRQALIRMRKL